MRLVIITTFVSLTAMSTAFAQDEDRDSRTMAVPPAATTKADAKDIATGSVPGLVTADEENAIPYRACLNARGWENGRLVCSESFAPAGRHTKSR
jgi:hypothetical protein